MTLDPDHDHDHDTVKQRVKDQFGATAAAYVTSAGHASGDDLQIVLDFAQPKPTDHALDVATGGGHTAIALAAHVAQVTATDLTPEMLRAAATEARRRAATNITFEAADAENLPFPDQAFEIVTSRIAPHHFPNPQRFVSEAARVLKPGGRFVLDDNMPPDDAELDEFMNRFEKWRDPSHIRAVPASLWRTWMEAAGLHLTAETQLAFKRHPFAAWTARAQLPPTERRALAEWLLASPPKCRDYFRVEPAVTPEAADGVEAISATWAVIAAQKPA